jgi:hypothetical protein
MPWLQINLLTAVAAVGAFEGLIYEVSDWLFCYLWLHVNQVMQVLSP